MALLDNQLYQEDIASVANADLDWARFKNKSILITGASGMIGTFLIDVLMSKSQELHCDVYAMGRDQEKAKQRFFHYWGNDGFHFVQGDINVGLTLETSKIDYIIHAASNTHPIAYSSDPIETILTNVIGTKVLLDYASKHQCKRFVFLSSVEIYGENRKDCERFAEDYSGYIDCNTLRAGYPESKRTGEALCQAYRKQKNMDVVIMRLPRVYGPTVLMTDTKALSQFIKKGVAGENIVLKSKGKQLFSYGYVADVVSGILKGLFDGVCGEAYNIADERSDITLKELAGIVADIAKTEVIFELPDAKEQQGYSTATKALLDGKKFQSLGWKAKYDIHAGLSRTIEMLRICETLSV